mgnify:CR=1 FL=1|jgi:hypothetical protein
MIKTLANRFSDINIWKTLNKKIYDQIMDENDDAVLPKLNKLLENKRLVVVESAFNKFLDLVESFGSKNELARTNILKKN